MPDLSRKNFKQGDFLELKIRASVVAKLIEQHLLCAEDLHCQNLQDKNVLLGMLLHSIKFE